MTNTYDETLALTLQSILATNLYMELHDRVLYMIFDKNDIERIQSSHVMSQETQVLHKVMGLLNDWTMQSYFLCSPDPRNPLAIGYITLHKKEDEVLQLIIHDPYFASRWSPLMTQISRAFSVIRFLHHEMHPYFTTQVYIAKDGHATIGYNTLPKDHRNLFVKSQQGQFLVSDLILKLAAECADFTCITRAMSRLIKFDDLRFMMQFTTPEFQNKFWNIYFNSTDQYGRHYSDVRESQEFHQLCQNLLQIQRLIFVEYTHWSDKQRLSRRLRP